MNYFFPFYEIKGITKTLKFPCIRSLEGHFLLSIPSIIKKKKKNSSEFEIVLTVLSDYIN